ncbi:MAG: CDP-archaeol synthase [Ectothiorhodospiraceae bacterium]|nr:CDP-archaeol synthase [Ectothiorhodospiraceae bacterium]
MSLIIALSILVTVNAAPVLASALMRDYLARPVDGGRVLADGQPLFGISKTYRGITVSLVAGALVAVMFGLPVEAGLAAAAAAMGGDLLSSFIKRRLHMASSARFLVLDQLPESLLPALVLTIWLGYGLTGALVASALFVALCLPLSWCMLQLGLRQQPH